MSKLQQVIKPRVSTARKGDYGRILVVGGSRDYVGAPYFVGKAALVAGADKVVVAAPEDCAWALNTLDPNIITFKLKGDYFGRAHVDPVAALAQSFDVVVIGNGLGDQDHTREAVASLLKLLEKAKKPMIIDADGFKPKYIPKGAVLTPHAGEFEYLFGKLPKKPENLKETVTKAAAETKTTILLKSGIDIISDGKQTEQNYTHNPEMTVGGTGDTLAGILATFLAQSNKPFESTVAAAWVNGMAGDLCLRGKRRVLASWLIDYIPEAISQGL